MATTFAARARPFIIYDGTNAEEIKTAAINAFGVPAELINESEQDGVLSFSIVAPPYSYVNSPIECQFNQGDVYEVGTLGGVILAAEWATEFIRMP